MSEAKLSAISEKFKESKEALQFFLNEGDEGKHVFQFGIGCTTQWVLGTESTTLLSIEEDQHWMNEVYDNLTKEQQGRARFQYSKYKSKTKEWARKYASAIHSCNKIPDAIIVSSDPSNIMVEEAIKYIKQTPEANPRIYLWNMGKPTSQLASGMLQPIKNTENLLLKPYTAQ